MVFHDVDNVPPRAANNDQLILERLVQYVQPRGYIDQYYMYLSNTQYIQSLEFIYETLKPLDIWLHRFHECVYPVEDGEKNGVDYDMMVMIILFALNNPEIQNYILITGDGDFYGMVRILEALEKNVSVFSQEHITNSYLKPYRI